MKRTLLKNCFALCALATFFALPYNGYAYRSYLNAFNELYSTSGTRLDSCSVCHDNSYLDDFAEELNGSIEDALVAIESIDSDGDSFSNLAEILQLTFPGDAQDSPGIWSAATDLGDGWRWTQWFGYFNITADPWIFHNEHGWLLYIGTDLSSLWFWDNELGWLWTSQSTYPAMYRVSDGAWLWYQVGSANPRMFYNFNTSQWEQH